MKYDQKQVAKKIKEIYPEHTEESLDNALNNSLSMIDEIVDRETEKALEQHKQQLKIRLGGREKLEASFVDLGFAANAEEIDIKGTCLWVPASFRHDVNKGYSRAVYGGVHILGIARHISPAQMQILARQTTQAGQRLWQNKVWGDAANRYHATLVQQQLSNPNMTVKPEHYVSTGHGARFLDVAVLSGKTLQQGYEVKTGNSPYTHAQQMKDNWIRENQCNVNLVRYPGCPIQ